MDEAGLRESRGGGSVHRVHVYSDLVQAVPVGYAGGGGLNTGIIADLPLKPLNLAPHKYLASFEMLSWRESVCEPFKRFHVAPDRIPLS